MSAGLSWKLMFQKREIFRACFVDFDYNKVAGFIDSDINAAMEHQDIIRSRRKIEVIVTIAQAFIRIIEEFGSFETYLWKYTNGQTYIYHHHLDCEWITKNELSAAIATDLKKHGFKYLGSTLIYSFLPSIGMINGHSTGCWMLEKIGGILSNEQNPQTSARSQHTPHLSLQQKVKSTYGNEPN